LSCRHCRAFLCRRRRLRTLSVTQFAILQQADHVLLLALPLQPRPRPCHFFFQLTTALRSRLWHWRATPQLRLSSTWQRTTSTVIHATPSSRGSRPGPLESLRQAAPSSSTPFLHVSLCPLGSMPCRHLVISPNVRPFFSLLSLTVSSLRGGTSRTSIMLCLLFSRYHCIVRSAGDGLEGYQPHGPTGVDDVPL
jgi:hypothetical protein